MTTNDQPIEHVEGQQPLMPEPEQAAAGPLADAPSTEAPAAPTSADTGPPSDDDSEPAPAPASPVPLADEYVIPDQAEQDQLDSLVPDDPTPLDGDGHDEGDDQ